MRMRGKADKKGKNDILIRKEQAILWRVASYHN